MTSTATVKYLAIDQVGNVETAHSMLVAIDGGAPTVSITSPASGAVLTGTVTLAADASDDGGIDHVDFLVDAQLVGTDTTSPYTFDWDSSTVGSGGHSITARAVDGANNATTSAAVPVTVGNSSDTTPPITTIRCNLTVCASLYASGVSVSLTAADEPGGSGVAEIRYTTDGSDPDATTGTVYTVPFQVFVTTTVKYRAFDNAGNAEESRAVRSRSTRPHRRSRSQARARKRV